MRNETETEQTPAVPYPEVSIIIPVYNGSRLVAKTVQSALNQSFSNVEVITIDDGSKDDSYSILKDLALSDSRVKAFSQQNRGVAHTRNRGFALAHPESQYLLFLDQDDCLRSDCIARLKVLLESSSYPAAYGLAQKVNEDGKPWFHSVEEADGFNRIDISRSKRNPLDPSEPTSLGVMVTWPAFNTPGQMLIRRSAIEVAGLFDPLCAGGDEWELAMRLAMQGSLGYLPQFVIDKGEHANNATKIKGYVKRSGRNIRIKVATHAAYESYRSLMLQGHRLSILLLLSWSVRALKNHDFRNTFRFIRDAVNTSILYLRIRSAATK